MAHAIHNFACTLKPLGGRTFYPHIAEIRPGGSDRSIGSSIHRILELKT